MKASTDSPELLFVEVSLTVMLYVCPRAEQYLYEEFYHSRLQSSKEKADKTSRELNRVGRNLSSFTKICDVNLKTFLLEKVCFSTS